MPVLIWQEECISTKQKEHTQAGAQYMQRFRHPQAEDIGVRRREKDTSLRRFKHKQ